MAFGDDKAMSCEAQGHNVAIIVTAAGMTELTVYRVISGGTLDVRGAKDTAPTGSGIWTGADVEAPPGQTLEYAADITDGSTVVTVGPVTATGQVDHEGDWILPTGNPNIAMNITVEAGGVGDLVRDSQQDVQPVLNRASPVVVSFGRRYFQGDLTFLTLSAAEQEQFLDIINYPVVMFVSRPDYGFDEPVYLALGRVKEERTSPFGAEDSRRWEVEVVKVDRPPADYPYTAIGVTWQEREDVPNTWTTAKANYTNWRVYAGYPA
jgi:hypothetical protein